MRYLATGVVHPERADVSFSELNLNLAGNGKATISCLASQIFVAVEIPEIDGFLAAKITAEHISHLVVGSLGFALGTGYSVEIIQVIEEPPKQHVIGVRPGNLGFEPHQPIFVRALHFSGEDIFFRLALRDYMRAIRDAEDCAMNCFRAVEAVKSAVEFRTGFDGWGPMHKLLGTSRADIDLKIKSFADPVRHGNWIAIKPTTTAIRNEMLLLTRDVFLRYLDKYKPT